jgi:hypothetical protein
MAHVENLPNISRECSGRRHNNFGVEISEDLDELGVSDNSKRMMASSCPQHNLHLKLGAEYVEPCKKEAIAQEAAESEGSQPSAWHTRLLVLLSCRTHETLMEGWLCG